MNARIVAIDGMAGSGKSTVARLLAGRLDVPYINTGRMYRAVAAAALREGVDPDDGDRLAELSSRLRFRLVGGDPETLEVEGWTVEALDTPAVESVVSDVARHPAVRRTLRSAQRSLGRGGAVMEGRDIGSVVFPDAAVKIYLVAAPEVRAARRGSERDEGTSVVGAAIDARDRRDAATTPAVPSPGAHVVDTTELTVDDVLDHVLSLVSRAAPELLP
jgi:cytidylate kinase